MSEGAILELSDLSRTFIQGEARIDVLRGVSFQIAPGEVIALTGPSGAGKSTLLQIAGLLERPDGGEIKLAGKSCAAMSESQRTRARREMLGFVYQFHHLLPEFSALENVMLPQLIGGTGKRRARAHASELLDRLGVAGRLNHRPTQLSGGEQQRVAIARALANRPVLLLADEPTGNVDDHIALRLMYLFEELNKNGTTIVFPAIAASNKAVDTNPITTSDLLIKSWASTAGLICKFVTLECQPWRRSS